MFYGCGSRGAGVKSLQVFEDGGQEEGPVLITIGLSFLLYCVFSMNGFSILPSPQYSATCMLPQAKLIFPVAILVSGTLSFNLITLSQN